MQENQVRTRIEAYFRDIRQTSGFKISCIGNITKAKHTGWFRPVLLLRIIITIFHEDEHQVGFSPENQKLSETEPFVHHHPGWIVRIQSIKESPLTLVEI